LVYNILSKIDLDYNKVALPLVTFIHPLWYMGKVYSQFENSNKILITPLLFNYTLDDLRISLNELRSLDLGLETDELEIAKITITGRMQKMDSPAPNLVQSLEDLKTRHRKFRLRIAKNDIFDIFDSI
jgi:hypothetical protein